MLDFNNTKIAFEAKTDAELRNAYILFNVNGLTDRRRSIFPALIRA